MKQRLVTVQHDHGGCAARLAQRPKSASAEGGGQRADEAGSSRQCARLPELSRGTTLDAQRRSARPEIRSTLRREVRDQPARTPPFLCDPSARQRRRPSCDTGIAGPCPLSTTHVYPQCRQLIDVYQSHPRLTNVPVATTPSCRLWTATLDFRPRPIPPGHRSAARGSSIGVPLGGSCASRQAFVVVPLTIYPHGN